MKKLLRLLLFLTIPLFAQIPITVPIPPQRQCDANQDGFEQFDLALWRPVVLSGTNASLYTVTYFLTQTNAQNNVNVISPDLYQNNVPNQQTIYVRVQENVNPANFIVEPLSLIAEFPPLAPPLQSLTLYQNPFTGTATFNFLGYRQTINNSQPNVLGTYYTSFANAQTGTNNINESCFTNTINPQTIYVRVNSGYTDCYSITSFQVNVSNATNPNPAITITDPILKAMLISANPTNAIAENGCYHYMKIDINNDAEIQTDEAAVVSRLNIGNSFISSLGGITDFQYLNTLICNNNQLQTINLDGMLWLDALDCGANLLTTLDLSQTGITWLQCNNNNLSYVNLKNNRRQEVPPEFPGNWQGNPNLSNICADADEIDRFDDLMSINGYTGVAISSDCSLSVAQNQLSPSIRIYPNPTSDIININCSDKMLSLALYDASGRLLQNKAIDGFDTKIDISEYAKGIYILKIRKSSGIKNEKLIKE